MKIILSFPGKKRKDIFNQGIPLFKEFIKNFGPLKIDKKEEKEIDKFIDEIVEIMKDILEKKMESAFKQFDSKTYIKSFNRELEAKYNEKKDLENIPEKDFISNCKDFILEPIAEYSQNYGILSLFLKFTLIIQEICVKKKDENIK